MSWWARLNGWQQVALVAIVVPCASLLVYGLVSRGETFGGLVAGVVVVLGAMGWQASRTKAQFEEVRTDVGKVEKLANGNLSREATARAQAQQQAIDHLHAVYQQLIQVAAQTPSGTVIPPLPPLPPPAVLDEHPAI